MMKSSLISDDNLDMNNVKAGIFDDSEVVGLYFNPTAEVKRAKLQREAKRKLRERYKDKLKDFRNARHWKKEEKIFKRLDHVTSKLEKQTRDNKMHEDLHDMPEMHWVKDGDHYIDTEEVRYAKAEAFYSDEFFEEEGYSLHYIQNLDVLATQFLEEVEDEDSSASSSVTPIISNCPSVASSNQSNDTISVCTVTSCETNSIIDPQDFDQIDLLPNDFSSSKDVENYDMETLLCKPVQNADACGCTVNTTRVMGNSSNHTEIQVDCGANGCIIGPEHRENATDFRKIKPISAKGIQQTNENLMVDEVATLGLPHPNVDIGAKGFASKNVTGTVMSPQMLCRQHGWDSYVMIANVKDGTARLIFDTGSEPIVFECVMDNGLWYLKHPQDYGNENTGSNNDPNEVKVQKLNMHQAFELWHQRLGHCGTKTLRVQHDHCVGIPKLKGNTFYRCPSCMQRKLCTKQPYNSKVTPLGSVAKDNKATKVTSNDFKEKDEVDDMLDDLYMPDAVAGQHFAMDWGFMRGKDYSKKNEDGKLITSIDGKRCYCLIVDRATRYMWVIVSDSKEPPVNAVRDFLKKFRSKASQRSVRLDQDKALGKSKEFLKMLAEKEVDFIPQFTGTDSSAQNGLVERPHRTLADMVRCMLHSSDMGSEYWSYALVHAVRIKNRLYHSSIKMTPYQALTGRKPNLSNYRVFGCRVVARATKDGMKLDNTLLKGRFLGFTGTDKNIYFYDDNDGDIKNGHHVIFDEAYMTVPSIQQPLAAQALQRLGYTTREKLKEDDYSDSDLHVQLLTDTSKIPTADAAAGYTVYSDKTMEILPNRVGVIPLGLALRAPSGMFAKLISLPFDPGGKMIRVMSGVVDESKQVEQTVVVQNMSDDTLKIAQGEKVAIYSLHRKVEPDIVVVNDIIVKTSSDKPSTSKDVQTDTEDSDSEDEVSVRTTNVESKPTALPTAETLQAQALQDITVDLNIALDIPHDVYMSDNPFDAFERRRIYLYGSHSTAGLELQDDEVFQAPKFLSALPSQPAARMPRWKRDLRNGYVTHINEIRVKSIKEVEQAIQKARHYQEASIVVRFAVNTRAGISSDNGQPQIFLDQLNVIAKHLYELNHGDDYNKEREIVEKQRETLIENGAENIQTNSTALQYSSAAKSTFDEIASYVEEGYRLSAATLMTEEDEDTAKIQMETKKDQVKAKVKALKPSKTLKQKNKLTRTKIMKSGDDEMIEKFLESEEKQLNQYEAQETFGEPQYLPKGANLLSLIWVYLIKDDGTHKARCVCNGSKNMRGSVTLAQTYASALDQTGSRLFWAKAAIDNFVVIGADASNAFAEAPAPVAPLYVKVDQQFKDWYQKKYPGKKCELNMVLRVKKALQGHPESPRLWAKLIDRIIRELNLKPCAHEPNLYYTNNYAGTGKRVLFLRQVDDFAIACENQELAKQVVDDINSKMSIQVKYLDVITRYNGVDITQTKHYIKLSNATYIDKILRDHPWIKDLKPAGSFPIPMSDASEYQRKLENAIPLTAEELEAIQSDLQFTYRQAIGELIYALCTCRPDISFAVTKLSQYSDRPAKEHFEAIQQVYLYLQATKEDGIIYWRKEPRHDLPLGEIPVTKRDENYTPSLEKLQTSNTELHAAVDSDHAADTSHRKSVSGICIKLAGGVVLYKTIFQKSVALSSTEAEFYAAASAGKYILYVRSIMEEIGLPQYSATTLYEDNQGALLMAQAGKPTKRTRHVDLKVFALQDWVEHDLILVKRIDTTDNYSDAMTKATGRTLFYRHMDFMMGRVIPEYATNMMSKSKTISSPTTLTAKRTTFFYLSKFNLKDHWSLECHKAFSTGRVLYRRYGLPS